MGKKDGKIAVQKTVIRYGKPFTRTQWLTPEKAANFKDTVVLAPKVKSSDPITKPTGKPAKKSNLTMEQILKESRPKYSGKVVKFPCLTPGCDTELKAHIGELITCPKCGGVVKRLKE